MMEWWTWACFGVASALAGIGLTKCYMWHRHFNLHVRKRVLADSTSLWGCGSVLHTVSFLRLGAQRAARGCPELEAAVKAACDAVVCHGGRVGYVGRAIMLVPCVPFTDEHGFDVVLLCAWPSGDAAAAATWRNDALEGVWERDVSQCWWRNPCANLLVSVLFMQVMRLWTVLTCSTFSVVEPAIVGGSGGNDHTDGPGRDEVAATPYSSMDGADGDDTRGLVGTDTKPTAENMARMASFIDEQGDEGDGILVFNLLNDSESTRADKRSDTKYASQMMRMLSRHGGGIMHLGRCHSMGTAARDGDWRMHAAVHYPGRTFFSKLCRSRWCAEVIQGKKPGKSIACLTWPFFPTGEHAVCLQKY